MNRFSCVMSLVSKLAVYKSHELQRSLSYSTGDDRCNAKTAGASKGSDHEF